MNHDAKAVVERFFYEAINDRQLEILTEILSPEFRGNILEYEGTWNTRDEIIEMLGGVFVAFPDYHQVVHDWIVQDDKVVARWTTTGTHQGPYSGIAPTGKVIHEHGIDIFQVVDGQIVAHWVELDLLGIFEQMDAVTVHRSGTRPEMP
jgi:steroid delta-isomerase-like uncharacterized protein